MQIKQDEYTGTFKECLENSRYLTEWVCKTLDNRELFPNVYCQDQFDQLPFIGNGGKKIRFADVLILDFNNDGGTFFVEAKDFGSMIFYDCTGLPREYIDKKMIALGSRHVYLVFKENRETIKGRIEHERDLFFVHKLSNGKIRPIPYGERLDILMRNRNFEAEGKVKSKLSSYYDQPQYVWNLSACKPMRDVFLRDFGNTGDKDD